MSTTVKIYISSHKDAAYLKDEIFAPIQAGSALTSNKIPGFLRDDSGDNISSENPKYCELTTQYWVWKNQLETDYVGFFHYRRYLAFKKNKKVADVWGNIYEPVFTDEVADEYGLEPNLIAKGIEGFDIILPEKKDIRKMPGMGKNNRQQFLGSGYLHERDLDIMLAVLNEKYPEYSSFAQDYLAEHESYLNNMYIMRKEIFSAYCEWLFDILSECDKRINYENYSTEAIRTLGHLAERLLNIYIRRLSAQENLKIKELPTVYFEKTEPEKEYAPAFAADNVAIALAANDFYSPYLATTVKSICANASPRKNYDILIMNQDISAGNKEKISDIAGDQKNISIRFVDISRYGKKFEKLFTHGHFSIETWFRLAMPEMFSKYKKILYLDSDLVALKDVAELYATNVDGYLLAATHDADTAGIYNGYDPSRKNYIDNILKIEKPYEYFQAGVILFNLEEFRKVTKLPEMMSYAASYEWKLLDQDVLNNIAQGRVKNIDMAWNVMTDWAGIRIKDIISRAPKSLSDEYAAARKAPSIVHYAGPEKPWDNPEMDMSSYFWKYAKESGYYEVLIARLSKKDDEKDGGIKKAASKLLPRGTARGEFVRGIVSRIK